MKMPALQRVCSSGSQSTRSSAPAQRKPAAASISNQTLQRVLLGHTLQAKLAVSEPDDALEREADETAESVMRMADPAAPVRAGGAAGAAGILRKCAACGGAVTEPGAKCAACDAQDHAVQRKPAGNAAGTAASALVPGSGTPLPRAVRAFFEPRFERDFGDVRVHADRDAASAAQSLD